MLGVNRGEAALNPWLWPPMSKESSSDNELVETHYMRESARVYVRSAV